jgi:hypothetical protein
LKSAGAGGGVCRRSLHALPAVRNGSIAPVRLADRLTLGQRSTPAGILVAECLLRKLRCSARGGRPCLLRPVAVVASVGFGAGGCQRLAGFGRCMDHIARRKPDIQRSPETGIRAASRATAHGRQPRFLQFAVSRRSNAVGDRRRAATRRRSPLAVVGQWLPLATGNFRTTPSAVTAGVAPRAPSACKCASRRRRTRYGVRD